VIAELARSPIIRALAVFALLFLLAFALLPGSLVNDALDCFSIAAAVFVVATYGPSMIDALRQRAPGRVHLMIAGVVLVAIGYGGLRALREFVRELGTINVPHVHYIFGGLSVVMVFGAFLHIVATGRENGTVRPSAWWALALAIGCGAALTAVILFLRWYF
jgi:hypothetical protein